jgi:hypothetical protein
MDLNNTVNLSLLVKQVAVTIVTINKHISAHMETPLFCNSGGELFQGSVQDQAKYH